MEPMQADLLRLTLHYMDVATCMCLLHCDTELGKLLVQRLLAMGIAKIIPLVVCFQTAHAWLCNHQTLL